MTASGVEAIEPLPAGLHLGAREIKQHGECRITRCEPKDGIQEFEVFAVGYGRLLGFRPKTVRRVTASGVRYGTCSGLQLCGAPVSKDRILLKILVVVALIATAATMSWFGAPSKKRMAQINALVASHQLGNVNPKLQKKLDAQFRWLVANTGVKADVAVNKALRKDRLTLLVTDPRYVSLTHCGAGNAIFDPSLHAIFIDIGLVHPYEVNIIGTPSVSTMFSADDLPYVEHYTNFIIGHELGHWAKRSRASAFFYYGFNDGNSHLSEELDADRFAIETLRRGYARGGKSPGSPAVASVLSDDARLTDDVLAGIVQMNQNLLFSNSPYSPYFSDQAHPDFLTRVALAIKHVGGASPSSSRAAFLSAYTQRIADLGSWSHQELVFSGPISAAGFRNKSLWLAQVDIPPEPQGPGDNIVFEEKLYRIPGSSFSMANVASMGVSPPLKSVATGFSRVGEKFNYEESIGGWSERQFEDGNRDAGLPPAELPPDPHSSIIWAPSRWGGLQKEGILWQWDARGSRKTGKTSEKEFLSTLRLRFPRGTIALGHPQWCDNQVTLPFKVEDGDVQSFYALAIDSSDRITLDTKDAVTLRVEGAAIDIKGATYWHRAWWVPVRRDANAAGYRTQIWRLTSNSQELFGETKFLPAGHDAAADKRYLDGIDPESVKFKPTSNEKVVFGYDGDALYLIDDHGSPADRIRLLFAPASEGVGVIDLGAGVLAIWNLNSRKIYFIDTKARTNIAAAGG
jgi:hypothetical protein